MKSPRVVVAINITSSQVNKVSTSFLAVDQINTCVCSNVTGTRDFSDVAVSQLHRYSIASHVTLKINSRRANEVLHLSRVFAYLDASRLGEGNQSAYDASQSVLCRYVAKYVASASSQYIGLEFT